MENLKVCSKCNLAFDINYNTDLFKELDVKPVHVILHDAIVRASSYRATIDIITNNDSKHDNCMLCQQCANIYKYKEYKEFLDKIYYLKCIYCKETKPQKSFMTFTANMREFFNFYQEELTSRSEEITNRCQKCQQFSSVIGLTVQSVSLELQINYFSQLGEVELASNTFQQLQYLRNQISTLTSRPFASALTHQLENCVNEKMQILEELEFIKLAKQRINHVSVNYSNSQHSRNGIKHLFNPIIGHPCPCSVCFGKMITVKKSLRSVKSLIVLPFYPTTPNTNIKSFINTKRLIQHPEYIKNIVYTEQCTHTPASLINICANKLSPEILKDILINYDISNKTRIQFYTTL